MILTAGLFTSKTGDTASFTVALLRQSTPRRSRGTVQYPSFALLVASLFCSVQNHLVR